MIIIGATLTLTACGPEANPVAVAATGQPIQTEVLPTNKASIVYTDQPPTPLPAPSATPRAPSYDLTATVWAQDPVVPILLYHQFADDISPNSDAVKIRLSDFRAHLETLHGLDFVFISLADWLQGDLRVPAGKSPIILTMDDLFYNNQITLSEDGTPSTASGIGVWWEFYNQYPDIGFEGALFANLGDKLYARPDKPDWEEKLANAIVWCIDHGLIPYNHFYSHPRLDLTPNEYLQYEARQNDNYLRALLAKVNRSDLIVHLDNIIALPYGHWPPSTAAQKIIKDYKTPEDKNLIGVMIADYAFRAEYMMAPYDPAFDRFNLPRIIGTQAAMDTLIENRDLYPKAETCSLTAGTPTASNDPQLVIAAIENAITLNICPRGVYAIDGLLFDARGNTVEQLFLTK